ncbi:MAG: hypothetical protein P4L53_03845 [Candidatus Obscuribacterales bacterium]|nr:hypothetical protein [Candidatus Obscuribacterales bacterium]
MEKTAIFWIRDGVLVDRMHLNPVAFAVAALEHADAKQATRTDFTELVNFAFATSGISCTDKMQKFNSERFLLISYVPAAAEYYSKLATDAAVHCHYFDNVCTLLQRLKHAGALNFITSAVEQSVLDSWAQSAQGSLLAPQLTEILGQRKNFNKGKDHYVYVRERYGIDRIIYVADAMAEIANGAQFSKQFNIVPVGFAHVITPAKVRLGYDLVMKARSELSPPSNASRNQFNLVESELALPDAKSLSHTLKSAQAADIVNGSSEQIMSNLADHFEKLGFQLRSISS